MLTLLSFDVLGLWNIVVFYYWCIGGNIILSVLCELINFQSGNLSYIFKFSFIKVKLTETVTEDINNIDNMTLDRDKRTILYYFNLYFYLRNSSTQDPH